MSTLGTYRPRSIIYESNVSQPWRLIDKGLNIEGVCNNLGCLAYDQMVVINLGFGEYDFARLILERKNQCPQCKKSIHPTKYALHKCQWWFVNHYSTHTYPLNTVLDKYELRDLHCEYVIIEIMPLKNYEKRPRTQETVCPICLNNIENDIDIMYLRCSHTFHRGCIRSWLQSNETMANKCPMCRNYISEKR